MCVLSRRYLIIEASKYQNGSFDSLGNYDLRILFVFCSHISTLVQSTAEPPSIYYLARSWIWMVGRMFVPSPNTGRAGVSPCHADWNGATHTHHRDDIIQ